MIGSPVGKKAEGIRWTLILKSGCLRLMLCKKHWTEEIHIDIIEKALKRRCGSERDCLGNNNKEESCCKTCQ